MFLCDLVCLTYPILRQPAQHDANSHSSHRGAVKGVQLYFWPAANHTLAGTLFKILAGYHVGFVFAYLSSLGVVFLSSRSTKKLRQKVENHTVTEDDLRAWGGFPFAVANWIAESRCQQALYAVPELNADWPWPINLILQWSCL